MPVPVVRLRDVRRDYVMGDEVTHALDGVDLDVQYGEFLAVVGPSGSGKSTMMNMIGVLDRPTSGTVMIAGYDVAELDDNQMTALRGQAIGFVFQQFQLLPRTSALDNVAAPLLYQGISQRKARQRAKEMLERLGLGDRLKNDRSQLSGGQQQRVAIARALVTNPALVLADEPTGALDSVSGAQVMEIFREINAEGRTVVLITHDQKIAENANRRVTMHDGKIASDTSITHEGVVLA